MGTSWSQEICGSRKHCHSQRFPCTSTYPWLLCALRMSSCHNNFLVKYSILSYYLSNTKLQSLCKVGLLINTTVLKFDDWNAFQFCLMDKIRGSHPIYFLLVKLIICSLIWWGESLLWWAGCWLLRTDGCAGLLGELWGLCCHTRWDAHAALQVAAMIAVSSNVTLIQAWSVS